MGTASMCCEGLSLERLSVEFVGLAAGGRRT